ncbi:MAG: M61 family peptidase, partial [Cyanobium sp.]
MPEGGGAEPLLLELDLREPQRHLVHARLRFTLRQATLTLRLPAGTPGSYLICDYVRTLEGLEIHQGGQQLLPRRREVATWTVALPSLEPLEVRWSVLAT